MEIINTTKKIILCRNVTVAKDFLAKTIGLLSSSTPQGLVFKTRWGIHTFGMKYSIDVLILDKDFLVVTLKENLLPNQIFFWNPKHDTVVELPSGSIAKSLTQLGDTISFD